MTGSPRLNDVIVNVIDGAERTNLTTMNVYVDVKGPNVTSK